MTHWTIAVLLGLVVICCWIGAVGAWRMREPNQSLHYLALPAASGVLLTIAVLVETGWSSAFVKTAFIAVLFLGTNSVGAHATARAIRVRRLGHWEARKEDGMEDAKGDSQK